MTEASQRRRRLQITQHLQQMVTKPVLSTAEPASIPLASRSEPLPLSFAQQRMWVLEQLTRGNPLYVIPTAWRLIGPLDIASLERSFAAIVQRHESLRTVFLAQDGEPQQWIMEQVPGALPLLDFQRVDPVGGTEEVRRVLEQEAQRSFDLEQGPLFHFTLLQLEDAEHLLMLSLHHSIADGASIEIVLRELSSLYPAERRGLPARLPALPIQPADFAVWQRKVLAGRFLQEQLDYWKTALQGAPLIDLPTDHPRPAIQAFQGALASVLLPLELSARTKRLSQQNGTTLFMTLLTAFKLLLARYSGQTDIVVGTVVTSRTHVELEGVIGFLANTIVLRTDLSGDLSFVQALQRVRHNALEAYAHQETPFEKVVEALHPERDLSRSPLFQVMFALQQTPNAALTLDNLRIEPVYFEVSTAKFDLTFTVADAVEGLSCTIEYDTALFEQQSIQRLLQHWQVLLEKLVERPQQPLREIGLVSAEEYQNLLEAWHAPLPSTLNPRLFLEHFSQQVQVCPDAIAVCSGDAMLTYADLDAHANRLAHLLRRRGIGPDVLVGLCVPRSLEVLVALLSILKAGGAYLPLDPSYPRQRLEYMLADAQVTLVLTQQHMLERLPESRVTYLCLDQLVASLANEACTAPHVDLRAEHLAYVIYTSGTTGRPKGTMISHGGLSNYLTWAASFYGVERGMGSAVHSSLSFDLTVTGLFTPLLVGRRVVMVEEATGVEALAQVLRTYGHLSLLKVTPAHLPLLDASLEQEDLAGMELTLVIGGEALTRGDLERWMRLAPRFRYINEYGPTETVVGCSLYEVAPTESALQIPIGCPIAQTQIYLLDAGLQPVPIGVIGEIYITGAGVARGYWNQPDITAERFVPDPLSRIGGARMYRSGDRARYRADGVLEYLGRVDQQVKVRGFRIELGEIEAALAQHTAVRDSVVLVREEVTGEKRLVAYLVFSTQPFPSGKDLRSFLLQTLPEYMVPATFVSLEELPLNLNGKLDRQKLLAFDTPAIEYGSAYVPPRNALEAQFVEIWEQVLRREQIGVHDNFFELGGDSLLVIRMISLARTAGLQLIPQQLFQHQTIAELAAVVATGIPLSTEQADITDILPLKGQESQAKNAQTLKQSSGSGIQPFLGSRQPLTFPPHTRYVVTMVEMQEKREPDLLKGTIQYIVQYHDVLHLRISKEEADFRLFISDSDAGPALFVAHIASLSEEEQQKYIQSTATQIYLSLNTYNGYLSSFAYFDRGEQKTGLFLMILHHLLADDYSMEFLFQDLQHVSTQLASGKAPSLPAKTASVNGLAKRIRQYLHTDFPQELDYWSALSAKKRKIPTDFPDPQTGSLAIEASTLPQSKPNVVTLSLRKDETQKLLHLAQMKKVSIEDVLIAGLVRAVTRWLGEPGFHLYILNNGRTLFDDIDVSHTFGFVTTGLWIYFNFAQDISPRELLLTTIEQRNNVPNKGMGLGMAANYDGYDDLAWEQVLSSDKMKRATELYYSENIIFNYHGIIADDQPFMQTPGRPADQIYQDLVQPGISVNGPREGQAPSRLQADPVIKEGQLSLTWKYDEILYQRATIMSLVESQREAILAIIEDWLCQD
ncbi:MAG TPA: amino acid adenylation domain-containing protein [Ktedonobacteraceae bacterium]|nr:amino acid adenylation domain-containing protein [Ktedonobacteraceae bacterium]